MSGASIIVSGPPAVGKTTVAMALAGEFGMAHLSGGDILKEMAVEAGFSGGGSDWWDTEAGIRFLKVRQGDETFDREVDRRLIASLRRGRTVITSYTLPWLVGDGIKIWLSGSHASSASRMMGRDGMGMGDALRMTKERYDINKVFYKNLYGIDFGEDLSVFDVTIDTDQMSARQVIEASCRAVRGLL